MFPSNLINSCRTTAPSNETTTCLSLEDNASTMVFQEVGSLSQTGSSSKLNITLPLGSAFRKQLGAIISKSLSEEQCVKGLEFTAFCTSEMTVSNSKEDNLDQPMFLCK